jgi:hypothetical protein
MTNDGLPFATQSRQNLLIGVKPMAEQITINIVGNEVGVAYRPDTSEAVFRNEMHARELALNALASQAILHRQQSGIPIPQVLLDVVNERTFRDLQ